MLTVAGFKPSLDERNRRAKLDTELEIKKIKVRITEAEQDIEELQQRMKTTKDVRTVKTAIVTKTKALTVLRTSLQQREHELGLLEKSRSPADRLRVTELLTLNNEKNARQAAPSRVAMLMERSEAAASAVEDSTTLFDEFLVNPDAALSPEEQEEIDDYVAMQMQENLSLPPPYLSVSMPAIPSAQPVDVDALQRRLDALRF